MTTVDEAVKADAEFKRRMRLYAVEMADVVRASNCWLYGLIEQQRKQAVMLANASS